MCDAGDIFVEISCAACGVPLLQDGLGRTDVYMLHSIAETESEQLNLPGLAHGIQQPVLNGWTILDSWVCHRLDEPGEVSRFIERVTELLEVITVKWLISGSQLRPQKGTAAYRNKAMEFLEGGGN
jgi:hypothetical protein